MKYFYPILVLLIISTISFSGCLNLDSALDEKENSLTAYKASLTETSEQRNIRICKETVEEYHSSHTYYGGDIYVCGDMACDVWNMIKTNGINAKICIGNVESDISSFTEANHAWVLAEVSPNTWLALECTGGYVVYDNPLYYSGWFFYTPKQFKEYTRLLTQYNDQVSKYNRALDEYNELVEEYNNAGFLTKIALKDDLDSQTIIVNGRAEDVLETTEQINAILSY